jgi:hypothetical protein
MMKTTQILVMAAFLVTVTGCHKHDHEHGEDEEMPAMEKPIEAAPVSEAGTAPAKPTTMLPNEIDAADMRGANVEQDASGKKVLYWVDPMMPDRHFSKSGQSPFMDMKLAPQYAE